VNGNHVGKFDSCRYYLIGGVVVIISIIGREIIAHLLPADAPLYSLNSAAIVYPGDMVASFSDHYRITL
jgi:hypothetical protein